MEIYLIAIILGTVLVALLIQKSISMKKLNQKVKNLEQKINSFKSGQEEFSLNLSRINSNISNKEFVRDPLTDLLGRQAFEEHLGQLLNQSKRYNKSFALMMLNIDDFNLVNKTYGYETGDTTLIEIAKRIKNSIRQVDIVARYAGNVFVFLLPNLAMPETAVYAAQRLLDAVVLPITIGGKEISVTAGIGITIYPHDGQDEKTLLKNAEAALRMSKRSGKNLYQFYQQETHLLGKRELELKASIKSPEFLNSLVLHYEFYINTLTQENICMEAMPLLNHPELGIISFSEFARISANAGKTAELCEWMLRKSVDQFKKIQKHRINSPKQLVLPFTLKQIENLEFIKKMLVIIKGLDIHPQELIFEVEDEIEGADAVSLKQSFDQLHDSGIQIAVGILGLGHFALQKIKNIPINYLKVDNKLIKDIDTHVESKNILERILFLTNSMDISVLTEGVEKIEQKNVLESLGCYIMQGDIFKGNDSRFQINPSVEKS